jgi:hypothetical protein
MSPFEFQIPKVAIPRVVPTVPIVTARKETAAILLGERVQDEVFAFCVGTVAGGHTVPAQVPSQQFRKADDLCLWSLFPSKRIAGCPRVSLLSELGV